MFDDAHGEIGVVDGEGGKRSRREHDGALFDTDMYMNSVHSIWVMAAASSAPESRKRDSKFGGESYPRAAAHLAAGRGVDDRYRRYPSPLIHCCAYLQEPDCDIVEDTSSISFGAVAAVPESRWQARFHLNSNLDSTRLI